MRRTHYLTIVCGVLLGGTALWIGCGTTQRDCAEGRDSSCADLINPGAGGSTSTNSVTTASSMMASSSTGIDPGCAGEIVEGLSAEESKRLISDECGIFVQVDATAATEEGTQAAPYKSLQTAIDKAGNSKRVYVCANATTPYAEAVTVSAAVEVYGGFECDKGWVFKTATRSLLTGAAQQVTLTLTESAGGARIEGFKITSANATVKGESSVAVAVAAVVVALTLVACDLEAGEGAAGEDGASPMGAAMKGADAPMATSSNACVAPNQIVAGVAGTTTCSDGMTAGGLGGTGGVTGMSNGDGQPGAAGTPMDMADGLGGDGESASKCKDGQPGKDGDTGAPGVPNSSPGTLTLTGLQSIAAGDGKAGTRGHGGGGGGGAKAGVFCKAGMATVDGVGASGGGGGAGCCGGKGGGGGMAGGSSIALISLGTELQLMDVTLKAAKGGNGGSGTAGQKGGAVGVGVIGGASSGVASSNVGCLGGKGGEGGNGGPGGGGRGGHSIGLAVLGVPKMTASSSVPGTSGDGGLAGSGGSSANDGAKGLAEECWDFLNNKSCTK